MGQVHWTESALDDLKDILDFVRKDSHAYASRDLPTLFEPEEPAEE
jgi:hypothetical protein